MKKIYIFLLLLLSAHLLTLAKLQFTAWPEMFSFPYMVEKGFLIYRDFHHAYQPLLTIFLLLIYKSFGYKLLTLEVFTWSLVLLSDVFIFLISLKLIGKKVAALVPVVVFVLLQPFFEGNMLWFDLAVVPLILLSLYFLFEKRFFWSGLFLSLAILTKQQSVLFLFGYFTYFIFDKVRARQFLYFTVGGIVPVAITFIFLLSSGAFKDYIFWTFLFPLKYLPKIPGYSSLPNTKQILTMVFLSLPLIFLSRIKSSKSSVFLISILFLMSIISSLPRFSYFHLQPMVAIYAVAMALLIANHRTIYFLVVPFLVFLYLLKQNYIYFGLPARFYDDRAIELSQKITNVTKTNEKIYLLGPNSLIYVLTDRIPPKPWIENYVWHFEIPGMQEKMIEGWKMDPPMFIFWTTPKDGNWFDIGTYQPRQVADWITENYSKEKEIESGIWEWRRNK